MYSRDEIKALADKVLNMTRADARGADLRGRRAGRHALRQLLDHDQPRAVRPAADDQRPPRPEAGQRLDARAGRRIAEGGGRRGAGGGAESARQPEPRAAGEGAAGVRRRSTPSCRRPRTSARASARRGSSSRSTSARRRACSPPATSPRRTRPTASRTPKGCSATTSTRKPASSSPAAWRAAPGRDGPASPARRISRR